MQSTTADTTRYLATVRRGQEPWRWTALYLGHAQPRGYRNYFRNRYDWRLHWTPLCASNCYGKWTLGLCLGKRTIYLYSHR
jgi:hypothetical protein